MGPSNSLSFLKKILALGLIFSLVTGPEGAYAQGAFVETLPEPGAMVGLSAAFVPVLVKGLVVHPDKPLNFDLIVDSGNDTTEQSVIQEQTRRMAQYFLAAITVPEDQLWVNLSPYEKDRVIENELGQTVLGRDMLAQDYILKQLASSLIYPEKGLGKEFWARVYAQAQAKFGTTDIPVDTFNKVWIMPEKAEVFEKGDAVYVTGARLKVMLDSDREARSRQKDAVESRAPGGAAVPDERTAVAKALMREIVLPAIEKEVNAGRNFAVIRQVYYAAILAKWYRELVQDTLLADAYVGKNKVAGVTSDEKALREEIYQRYIAAYKKGVFNYIKEEPAAGGDTLPRQYFAGGIEDFAMKDVPLARTADFAAVSRSTVGSVFRVDLAMKNADSSMVTSQEALDYQAEVRRKFIESDEKARLQFSPETPLAQLEESIRTNNKDLVTFAHNVMVGGNASIREVYRDVQRIVREMSGENAPVVEMSLDEIHVTIANDEIAPGGALTLTLDQLMRDLQEEARGVQAFDIQLVGPHLMANGVVVMEYTTKAPEFLYLRHQAEKRMAALSLPKGNRAFVPGIIHSTVSIIRDSKIAPDTLRQIQIRLEQYRQRLTPISVRAEKITAVNFREQDRRVIEARDIQLVRAVDKDAARGVMLKAGLDPDRVIQGIVLVSDVDGVIRNGGSIDQKIVDRIKPLVEQGYMDVRYISGSAVLWPAFIENAGEEWRRDNPALGKAFVEAFGAEWLQRHERHVEVAGAMGGQRLKLEEGHPAVEFIPGHQYTEEQMFNGLKMLLQSFLMLAASVKPDKAREAMDLLARLAPVEHNAHDVMMTPEGALTPDVFREVMLGIRENIDPRARLINRGSDLELAVTRGMFPLDKAVPELNKLLTEIGSSFAKVDVQQRLVAVGSNYLKISKHSKAAAAEEFIHDRETQHQGWVTFSLGDGAVDVPMFEATQLSFFVGDDNELGTTRLLENTTYVRSPQGDARTLADGTVNVLGKITDAVNKPFKDLQCWTARKPDGMWDMLSLAELEAMPDMAKKADSHDPAQVRDLGGVDIRNVAVSRKTGGQRIRFNEQVLQNILKDDFNGFTPVIMGITPVQNSSVFPGLPDKAESSAPVP